MNVPIPVIGRLSPDELTTYLNLLNERLPNEQFVCASSLSANERAQCDIAVVANPEPKALEQFTSLVWVHSVWAGVENLVTHIGNKHIKIVRLVDPNLAQVMSEAVLAWTLYLHRNMPEYNKQQTQKLWRSLTYCLPHHRQVGILGLGELGKTSVQRLAQNGFNVIGWSRQQKQIDGVSCFSGEAGLNEVLLRADILISLLPLTSQTRYLLDKVNLSKLPTGSAIINFSRGAIVDIDALVHLLNEGHVSHAVLDVFDQEPLPASSDLWSHPNITILPHISAPTMAESACDIVSNNIQEYRLTGNIPPHVNALVGY